MKLIHFNRGKIEQEFYLSNDLQKGRIRLIKDYLATKMLFSNPDSPERIMIATKHLDYSLSFFEDILSYIENYLENLQLTVVRQNSKQIQLSNGCKLRAIYFNQESVQRYTPTLILTEDDISIMSYGD